VNSTEYLSLPQVAAELKCSVRTVRRYLKEGRLGYSQEKKGGVIRVSREDIAAYYQASRRGPAVARRRSARAAA
jgi:excisionase family DNA binding protein